MTDWGEALLPGPPDLDTHSVVGTSAWTMGLFPLGWGSAEHLVGVRTGWALGSPWNPTPPPGWRLVPALVFSDRFGQLAWRPAYWREWTGTSWERIRLYMFGDDPGPLDP